MAERTFEMRDMSEDRQAQSSAPKTSAENEEVSPLSPRSSITAREPVITYLYLRFWPFVVFIFYGIISSLPWVLLCIMNKRPIRKLKSYYDTDSYKVEKWFIINEHHFTAARVLQSIAALLTIPVTSAICSLAFVAYMQSGPLRKSLTLSQSMALADQGWLSLRIWSKIGYRGSAPLLFAFVLTLIGSVGQILQSALVDKENIQGYQRSYGLSNAVMDVPDLINGRDLYSDSGRAIQQLRSYLESASSVDSDFNVWGAPTYPNSRDFRYQFMDLGSYNKPPPNHYFVPLPLNFSSGAYPEPQYAPRINSSISYHNITAEEYKKECRNETETGSFYALYKAEWTPYTESYDLTVEVCMMADLRNSPWKATRDRQDITETMYLYYNSSYTSGSEKYMKATANTSLGYFELPNSRNGNNPGNLLDRDPLTGENKQTRWLARRADNPTDANFTYNGNATLLQAPNKGPLASLTLALFGANSFVASRLENPAGFVVPPAYMEKDEDGEIEWPRGSGNCITMPPLNGLTSSSQCISDERSLDEEDIIQSVEEWLYDFVNMNSSYEVALNVGLYLANKIWLSGKGNDGFDRNLEVYGDPGIPTFKPKISDGGVIVGSVLLGLHLLGLLLLAMYACVMKPWAGRMGSEVMLKMGMVYADALGRAESKEQFERATRELPGFIGDDRPDQEVGRMRFGAQSGLSRLKNRKFEILR